MLVLYLFIVKDLIRNILKEMSVPLSVRRRMPYFDDTFIHYRKSLMDYNFRTFKGFWNEVLEKSLGTLYHSWFINAVPEDDWEESEKYIKDYLTEKYYDETEKMWKKQKNINESEQDDWYNTLVKKVKLIDTIIKTFYPNFNKDNTLISQKISQAGYDALTYDDPETGFPFATYWVKDRALDLNFELFETLENYLGEEEMLYVIEWFNNEFNQHAEYVGI